VTLVGAPGLRASEVDLGGEPPVQRGKARDSLALIGVPGSVKPTMSLNKVTVRLNGASDTNITSGRPRPRRRHDFVSDAATTKSL
jgi:hypothetical protein